MTPSANQLLKYAQLQLAAEGISLEPGMSDEDLRKALIAGNGRGNRFAAADAKAFADAGWTVLKTRETNSGFNGVLFKSASGELVLSMRSTEFLDDAVRDNEQTNKAEIIDHGWAFGQIADMEAWYAELKNDPALLGPDKHFTVTGYSLGGHLATAFDVLRHEDNTSARIDGVYTFNGAGVGRYDTGMPTPGDTSGHPGRRV